MKEMKVLKDGNSLATLTTFGDDNPALAIHTNTFWAKNFRGSRGLPSNRLDVSAILMDHLNPTVAVISHQDVVIRIHKEMPGILDLPSTHDPTKLP